VAGTFTDKSVCRSMAFPTQPFNIQMMFIRVTEVMMSLKPFGHLPATFATIWFNQFAGL
jgi:hypothetical protein